MDLCSDYTCTRLPSFDSEDGEVCTGQLSAQHACSRDDMRIPPKEAMTRIVLQGHVAERDHIRRTSSRIACSIILSPWLYLQWQRSAHSKRSTLGPKGKSSLQDAARAESVHRMLFLAFSSIFFDKSQGWAPQSFSHALQMLLAPPEDLWWHGWLVLAE